MIKIARSWVVTEHRTVVFEYLGRREGLSENEVRQIAASRDDRCGFIVSDSTVRHAYPIQEGAADA